MSAIWPASSFGVRIDARIVPGVNPVHHPKQAEHRDPAGEIESAIALVFFEQRDADAIVLAFDGRDLAPKLFFSTSSSCERTFIAF